jgi:hypothetical protein
VSAHRFGSLLRLASDAVLLELEFGTQSLEALAWIGRTVESSVYLSGSLARTPTGFRFALANPPLRIGAFSGVRLLVEGTPVDPAQVRLRVGPGLPWRTTTSLSAEHPLELQAGSTLEFESNSPLEGTPKTLTIRLEFQSIAIPPLVWVEFRETLRGDPIS